MTTHSQGRRGGRTQASTNSLLGLLSPWPLLTQRHTEEFNLTLWLARVRLHLLDFERHTLRDTNAHSSTQDTVSGDLSLSSILHYCPKEACPVGRSQLLTTRLSCPPATQKPLENSSASMPRPSMGADAVMLLGVPAALEHPGVL